MNLFYLPTRVRQVLCLAFLLAGACVPMNAQVEAIMDLESGTTGWTVSGHSTTTAQACAGTSWRDNIYSSSAYGWVMSPSYTAVSNGTDVTVDFDYKVVDWSAATVATTGDWGSVVVDYTIDGGTTWDTLTVIDQTNHVVSNVCATISNTIPAASIPSGSDFQIRFAGNFGTAGDFYLYFDNISCTQVPTSPPNCTQVDDPADGAIDVNEDADISWPTATGIATGYFVTVGTTSGGTDVVNHVDVGNVTTYDLGTLAFSTTYYVEINPYNTVGERSACTETSFTTRADPTVSSYPYTIDFENAGAVPNGWYQGASNSEDWRFGTAGAAAYGPTSDHTSGSGYYAWIDDSSPHNTGTTITSPSLDLTSLTSPFVSFFLWSEDHSTASQFLLHVIVNGTDTVTTFDANNTGWEEIGVDLSAYTGQTITLSFVGDELGTGFQKDIAIDDITVGETPTTPPLCTAATNPADGATDVPVDTHIDWAGTTGFPDGYYVSVGTTPGASDVVAHVDAGDTTSYDIPADLNYGATYYVVINPYNGNGEALGCDTTSFTTPSVPPNCVTLTSPADAAVDVNENDDLSWPAATGVPASGYKINMGTTPGGVDFLDNFDAGNVTTYDQGTMAYATTYYVTVIAYNGNGDASGCDTTSFTTRVDPTVAAPYTESFEAFPTTTNSTINTGGWASNPTGTTSLYRWNIDASGSTPSSFTGPDAGAYDGTNYLYVEASSGAALAEAMLMSPPINLAALTTPALTFQYHMYGVNMGDLNVEVSTDGGVTWNAPELVISGQQQTSGTDAWREGYVPLSAYSGIISIRLRAVRGSSYEGDISIDYFSVDEAPACPNPNSQSDTTTATTAALSWNETGTATSWIIEYGPQGFTPGTGTEMAAASNMHFPISGLSPATWYDWYVTTDCGSDTSAMVGPSTFITDCAAVTEFVENFDNYATGTNLPACWTRHVTGATSNSTITISTSADVSAPNGLYMYASTSADTCFAVMPELSNAGDGTHRLKFTARGTSTASPTPMIIVGSMSDPMDPSTFMVIDTVDLTTSFDDYIVEPGTAPGTDAYLAFRNPNIAKTVYIDDVKWEILPDCGDVLSPSVSNTTDLTASFQWLPPAGTVPVQYLVEVGLPGFTPGTGTEVSSNTSATTSVTVSGLNPNTEYEAWIQSDCSDAYGAWIGPVAFKTECENATTFYDDFTGYPTGSANPLADCWNRLVDGGSCYLTTTTSYGITAPSIYMYAANSTTNPNTSMAISPPVSNLGSGSHRLKFRAATSSTATPATYLLVGTMSNPTDSASFVMLDTVFLTNSMADFTIEPGVVSGANYLAFFLPRQSRNAYVDEVRWEAIPDCQDLMGLASTVVTNNSVGGIWSTEATATGYEWVVDTIGGMLGVTTPAATGTTTDTSFVATTGLMASTTYEIYARVTCAAGVGAWQGPVTVTTDDPPVTAPIFEDFETFSLTTNSTVATNGWSSNPSGTTSLFRWNVDGTGSTPSSNTGPTNGAFDGNNYFYTEASSGATGAEANLYTPLVDVSALTAPYLTFKYHMYGVNMGDLNVYVTADGGATWTNHLIYSGQQQTAGTDAWLEGAVDLGDYIGMTIKIRFNGVRSTSYEGDMCIDAVSVDEAPACVSPTTPAAAGDCAGINLTWTETSTATLWDILEAASTATPDGATTPTVDDHTAQSYSFTGLTQDSTYYYWVRSDCGGGATSDWVGPFSATYSVPAIDTLPYTQDFNSGTSITALGWSNVTSTWLINSTHGQSGNGAYANVYSSVPTRTVQTPFYGPIAAGHVLAFDTRVLNFSSYPNGGNPGTGYGSVSVEMSTDCGATYNTIATYGDDILATSATEWFAKEIDLTAYAGMDVSFRFTGSYTSGDWHVDLDNLVLDQVCVGAPTAGTATGPSGAVCSGTSFDVVLDGYSNAIGTSLYWEESADGTTWTSLTGSTAATFTTSLAGADMYYHAVVSCSNSGMTATSNDVFVENETDICVCACAGGATSPGDTKIDTITLGSYTIGTDPSTCEQYTQHCSPGITFEPGEVVPLEIINGSCSGTPYNAVAAAFADWNGDGDFTDAGDTLFVSATVNTLGAIPATTFTVPSTAIVGNDVLIRVAIKEGTTMPSACGTYSFGEAEDFIVTIDATCDDPLTGVTALVLDSTRAAVAWDANPSAGFFKIQYRELGASSWNPIINVKNRDYQRVAWILPGLTPNTTYQYRVRQQCPDFSVGPYSSIQTFTTFTTSPCEIPNDSKIVYLQDADKVRVFLDYEPTGERYDIRWKLQGTTVILDNKITKKSSTVIDGLSPSTDYEYRVRTKCSGVWTGYSSWKAFSTHGIGAPLAPPASPRGDYSVSTELAVYPNPVDQTLFVEFEGTGEKHIRMMDMSGRLVLDQIAQDQLEVLDVARFANGTYFMQVIFDNGDVVTKKVVKQ